jgi:glycosyltransferase involved in cell wall biosynthesis
VHDIAQFAFYAAALDSVAALGQAVEGFARTSSDPAQLRASFASARIAIVGNVLNYLQTSVGEELQGEGLRLLEEKASPADVVSAAVRYFPGALELLARHGRRIEAGERPVRSVLLTTKTLRTGGVSAVLRSQAHFLHAAGCRVTIAATGPDSNVEGLPEGVTVVEVTGRLPERVEQWAELCRTQAVDVVIDHQVLYSRQWPAYALMARALGVPTIGWIHNFSMRPVYNGTDLLTFLKANLSALATVVTLSSLDVAFWKLSGIEHAAYLPNPPSPLLLNSSSSAAPRTAPSGPIKLVWWGRLEEHTKQVSQLIEVADHLRRLAVDFELTIIGPEWAGLTPDKLEETVRKRKLEAFVRVVGARYGDDLIACIDDADLFLSTSIIEGYQLTLAEGQSRGLPVAMYELPWLTLVQDNGGMITAPQGDAAALARAILELRDDPERYERMSAASIEAAHRATTFDFATLYRQLVAGELPRDYSPEPTLEDARDLLAWMGFFAGRAAAKQVASQRGGAPGAAPAPPASVARRAARRVVRRYPALAPLARRVARRR